MDVLILISRIMSLTFVATAAGISVVEYVRLRKLHGPPADRRGLAATATLAVMALAFRMATTSYVFGFFSLELITLLANTFFVFFGIVMSISALGMYRSAIQRDFIDRVEKAVEEQVHGDS